MESPTQFESRKQDHLRLALDSRVQAFANGLDRVDLIHEALPEINFSDVDLSSSFRNQKLSSPFFISSMTGGHQESASINRALAALSAERQILMGVGSQRRELNDPAALTEWSKIREESPHALLLGNLGLAQIIHTPISVVQRLMDNLGALGLFIHLNSLQEALQPEGTPDFAGGLEKIQELARALPFPVILKEVGCGFSVSTLKKIEGSGVFAVDVGGYGGTHWGRIEGERAPAGSVQALAAGTFANWGISTVESMLGAAEARVSYQVWASGGVRNGLEAAKLISLGAELVGLAQPWLAAYNQNSAHPRAALTGLADRLEFELKTALFCTGSRTPAELRQKKVWKWRE